MALYFSFDKVLCLLTIWIFKSFSLSRIYSYSCGKDEIFRVHNNTAASKQFISKTFPVLQIKYVAL